ncbi:unnamed protein product [Phytomonas sp. EM1]|nr:unnamed protein product [Phytomonas sp. EM1]|eukprot:CCW64893.1 unnamed protein product [Phytomonas sp. isolate EM1]
MPEEGSVGSSGPENVDATQLDGLNPAESSREGGSDGHNARARCRLGGASEVPFAGDPSSCGVAGRPNRGSSVDTTPSSSSIQAAPESASDATTRTPPSSLTRGSEIPANSRTPTASSALTRIPPNESPNDTIDGNPVRDGLMQHRGVETATKVRSSPCGKESDGRNTPTDGDDEADAKKSITLLQYQPHQLLSSSASCDAAASNWRKEDSSVSDDRPFLVGEAPEKETRVFPRGFPSLGNPTAGVSSKPTSPSSRSTTTVMKWQPQPESVIPATRASPRQVRAISRVDFCAKAAGNPPRAGETSPSRTSTQPQSIRLALPEFAAPSQSTSSLTNPSDSARKGGEERVPLRTSLFSLKEVGMSEMKMAGEKSVAKFNLPPFPPPSSSLSTLVRFAAPNSARQPERAAPPQEGLTTNGSTSQISSAEEEIQQLLGKIRKEQEKYHAENKAYYHSECVMHPTPDKISEKQTTAAISPTQIDKDLLPSYPPLQYLLNQSAGLEWEERLKRLQNKERTRYHPEVTTRKITSAVDCHDVNNGDEKAPLVRLNTTFLKEILGICGRTLSHAEDDAEEGFRCEGNPAMAEVTSGESSTTQKERKENKENNEEKALRRKWSAARRLTSVMRALSFQPCDHAQRGWLAADPLLWRGSSAWGIEEESSLMAAENSGDAVSNASKASLIDGEGRSTADKTTNARIQQILYPMRSVLPCTSVVLSEKGKIGVSRFPNSSATDISKVGNSSRANLDDKALLTSFCSAADEGNGGDHSNPESISRQQDDLALTSTNMDAMVQWAYASLTESKKECLNEVLKRLDE